jgi:hypothetical protein
MADHYSSVLRSSATIAHNWLCNKRKRLYMGATAKFADFLFALTFKCLKQVLDGYLSKLRPTKQKAGSKPCNVSSSR